MNIIRLISVVFLIPVVYGLFRHIEYSGGQASFADIIPIFSLGIVIASVLTEYIYSVSSKEITNAINPKEIPETGDKMIPISVEVFFKNGKVIKQSVVPHSGSKTQDEIRYKWRTKKF